MCAISIVHVPDKEFSSYVFSVVQLCVETLVKQKVQNHLKFMRLFQQCLPSQATDVRNAGCLFYVKKKKTTKKQAVRLLNMWESLNLAFHARPSKTSVHCTERGVFRIHIDPALRGVESSLLSCQKNIYSFWF